MTALAALSWRCSRVLVTNLVQEKLDVIGRYSGATTTNGKTKTLPEEVAKLTNNWAPMSCLKRAAALRLMTAFSISSGPAAAWC